MELSHCSQWGLSWFTPPRVLAGIALTRNGSIDLVVQSWDPHTQVLLSHKLGDAVAWRGSLLHITRPPPLPTRFAEGLWCFLSSSTAGGCVFYIFV